MSRSFKQSQKQPGTVEHHCLSGCGNSGRGFLSPEHQACLDNLSSGCNYLVFAGITERRGATRPDGKSVSYLQKRFLPGANFELLSKHGIDLSGFDVFQPTSCAPWWSN